jgi:hypothetical protein
VTVLTTYGQFAKGRTLVEIVRVIDYQWAPCMAIHAGTQERAGKTERVLLVSRRKCPALSVGILAAGVKREGRFEKVITPPYTIPNTDHRLSQGKCNPFGIFREFRTVRARLELTHIVLAILSKDPETIVRILLANSCPRGRQISKLRTLTGKTGCLPMGSLHVVLVDFLVA